MTRSALVAAALVVVVCMAAVLACLRHCAVPSPVAEINERLMKEAQREGEELVDVVRGFLAHHTGASVTWDALIDAGDIERSVTVDPWGVPYELVRARDGRVFVVSMGPDREDFTDDDLEFPVK